MSDTLFVQWTIAPEIAPRPWLICSRCSDARPFAGSDKIRMNANGRRIDAWLIYKCSACENTWNRPLLERRSVGEVDPSLLSALQTNDAEFVRRVAFDIEDLKRKVERVEECASASVRKTIVRGGATRISRLEISLFVQAPTALRLDRLLASEFAVARARVQELSVRGWLSVLPHGARMLRRAVRDGTRVAIELSAVNDIDVEKAG